MFLLRIVLLCAIASRNIGYARTIDEHLEKVEPKPKNHRMRRVVGGNDASIYEAPFVVQLIWNQITYCTGAIIGPETILTAAHCVYRTTPDFIVYGTDQKYSTSILQSNGSELQFQKARVQEVIIPPRYIDGAGAYDIAILSLTRAILPDPVAASIELEAEQGSCGEWVKSYGFGLTLAGSRSTGRMQSIQSQVQNSCSFFYSPGMQIYLKTRSPVSSSCYGDSGGPLVSSSGKLIGVLSGSPQGNCEPGNVNQFVKVSNHIRFLQQHSGQQVGQQDSSSLQAWRRSWTSFTGIFN